MQGDIMIGTGKGVTKSSTAAQLLFTAGPLTFVPLSLLKIPMMYCEAKAAPKGLSPFINNIQILYFFEFGAAPGPWYIYLISPPIMCVAKTSENKRINRQEKKDLFHVHSMMGKRNGLKANKNRRLCKAGGGLNLLTSVPDIIVSISRFP